MDWIDEIEKYAEARGRPPAMTTLALRISDRMKEEVILLAQYLTERRNLKSSAGSVARAFIGSSIRKMREPLRERWIKEIRKHSGGGMSEDVLTTLSFRLDRHLKKDLDGLASRLSPHFIDMFQCSSSIGALARAFIAHGLKETQAQYPEFKRFLAERRKKPRTVEGIELRVVSARSLQRCVGLGVFPDFLISLHLAKVNLPRRSIILRLSIDDVIPAEFPLPETLVVFDSAVLDNAVLASTDDLRKIEGFVALALNLRANAKRAVRLWIQCEKGLSLSPAVALLVLLLLRGDTASAIQAIAELAPEATVDCKPHRRASWSGRRIDQG
jgi:hypothetical protein